MAWKAKSARIALENLFMVGAVGAFFAALANDIPVDVQSLHIVTGRPIDWTYTLDRSVRYAYLIWFLGYFFVSDFRRVEEEKDASSYPHSPSPYDVFFYISQSVFSLGAAFCLGLLVPHEGFKDKDYGYAALSANIAIGLICGLSLLGYWKSASSTGRINVLRLSGLALAIISGCLAYAAQQSPSFGLLLTLNLLAVLLLIILACYGRQRL
jgi:hypothetical protein